MSIFKRLKSKLVLSIMNTKLYAYLLKNVIPFIRFNMYYTAMRGWKYKRGYSLLNTGDIILTKDNWKLTSFLIPGEFSHAALCVDKGIYTPFEIAEMTHENFSKSSFYDLCREADRVVIVRCRDWDDSYIKVVTSKCKSFDGTSYDIHFDLGVKSLYCSELVVQSDVENRLQVDYSDFVGIGREYISPMGLYLANNVEVVWDSDKEVK